MTKKRTPEASKSSSSVAGLLAWIVPGLGHLYLGHRARGITILVVITSTFWCGVAIGGVKSTVDLKENRIWFLAQICTGGQAIAATIWSSRLAPVVYECPTCHSELAGKPTVGTVCPSCQHRFTAKDDIRQLRLAFWPQVDIAIVYTGIAGLLNLLAILDAIARAEIEPLVRREMAGGPANG
jgi:TM2 domain-containing membrane protein YozV/DNA-directed RNA polymerase subunit RPC12/RpoP